MKAARSETRSCKPHQQVCGPCVDTRLAHDIARTGSVRAAVDGGVAPLPVLLAWVPSARGAATVDSYAEAVRAAQLRATSFVAAPLVVTALELVVQRTLFFWLP